MFSTFINVWYRLPVDLVYRECLAPNEVQCPCEYVEWVREASQDAFSKARDQIKKCAERQKTLYDKNTYMRTFKVGKWVWVLHPKELQHKFGRGWKGPFLVIVQLGDVTYVVQENSEARKITHKSY